MARHHDEQSKLVQILEETPLVNYACRKVGIGRTTFYRWMKDNLPFKKEVERALASGRSQWSEIAESALMKNVKKEKMDAIKFYLTHNDKRYIPKRAVFPPPEIDQKERERYEWAMRNKPIEKAKIDAMVKVLKNWGLVNDETKEKEGKDKDSKQ